MHPSSTACPSCDAVVAPEATRCDTCGLHLGPPPRPQRARPVPLRRPRSTRPLALAGGLAWLAAGAHGIHGMGLSRDEMLPFMLPAILALGVLWAFGGRRAVPS